jgi:hypothetical protein
MDILSSYSSGSAITDLRNANKAEAETQFNEMMNEINTQTADEDTLYGSVQKAGASITAVGAIGKGVITNFQKLKSKITGEDGDGAEGDGTQLDEVELQTYQGPARAPRQVEGQDEADAGEADTGGADTGATAQEPGLFDRGPNPFRGEEDEDVEGFDETDNIADNAVADDEPLFSAEITGEEGGEYTGVVGQEGATSFTSATTGGVLDPTGAEIETPTEDTFEAVGEEGLELGGEATADAAASGLSSVGTTLGNIVSSATSALSGTASSVSSAVNGAISATSSAVSGAVDATSGAITGAVESGITAGGEAAAAAGAGALESAGAALDATGVGAPVGLILNIIGGLVLGGTMTAGIVGEVDASNNQQSATADAQNQLKQATTGGLSNIAGRYAV